MAAERLFALRLLTAAALLAGFLAALRWLDAFAFAVLVGCVVALGAREWARLIGYREVAALGYMVACTSLFAAVAAWLQPLRGVASPLLAIWGVAAAFWLLGVPALLRYGLAAAGRMSLAVVGVVVLVPAALAMAWLAPGMLLAMLGLVWIADTGAYLAGRAFGRVKLAPAISPGKTWEGVAGGALGSLAYAIIVALSWPELGRRVVGAAWSVYLVSVMALCAASVLGDLFESAVKRRAGVKDSGALLPGHGGVLDRIDSASAVLPIGALLAAWMSAA